MCLGRAENGTLFALGNSGWTARTGEGVSGMVDFIALDGFATSGGVDAAQFLSNLVVGVAFLM